MLVCAAAVLAAGCGERDVRIQGTLADGWGDEPLFVSLGPGVEPSAVRNGAFTAEGVPAGAVELRILRGDDELGTMTIGELPGGATLSLERIRRDRARDRAFPSAVRLDGADVVTINGMRMADPQSLPGRIDETGVVLALDDGALIVRPRSADLPDLPVVVAAETEVRDVSGEPAALDAASAGDSVRVQGRTEAGYLFAERITLRRGASSASEAAPAAARESRAERPAASEDDGADGRREERRGSGRTDSRVPEGHRPPPGECRDWDPSLPPGQQPPPRKC